MIYVHRQDDNETNFMLLFPFVYITNPIHKYIYFISLGKFSVIAKEHNNSDKIGQSTMELNVRVPMALDRTAAGRDHYFTIFNMKPLPHMK